MAEAAREPYATGRRPKAAGAAARAICTVGLSETEPCIVARRRRRLVRRGIVIHPSELRPTAAEVGRGLPVAIRLIGSMRYARASSVPFSNIKGFFFMEFCSFLPSLNLLCCNLFSLRCTHDI